VVHAREGVEVGIEVGRGGQPELAAALGELLARLAHALAKVAGLAHEPGVEVGSRQIHHRRRRGAPEPDCDSPALGQ
jgi:hypothetical protein